MLANGSFKLGIGSYKMNSHEFEAKQVLHYILYFILDVHKKFANLCERCLVFFNLFKKTLNFYSVQG